jgi:hypothetical protein
MTELVLITTLKDIGTTSSTLRREVACSRFEEKGEYSHSAEIAAARQFGVGTSGPDDEDLELAQRAARCGWICGAHASLGTRQQLRPQGLRDKPPTLTSFLPP